MKLLTFTLFASALVGISCLKAQNGTRPGKETTKVQALPSWTPISVKNETNHTLTIDVKAEAGNLDQKYWKVPADFFTAQSKNASRLADGTQIQIRPDGYAPIMRVSRTDGITLGKSFTISGTTTIDSLAYPKPILSVKLDGTPAGSNLNFKVVAPWKQGLPKADVGVWFDDNKHHWVVLEVGAKFEDIYFGNSSSTQPHLFVFKPGSTTQASDIK